MDAFSFLRYNTAYKRGKIHFPKEAVMCYTIVGDFGGIAMLKVKNLGGFRKRK